MTKYSAAALSDIQQVCVDAEEWMSANFYLLNPTTEQRTTRQAQLKVRNVFGLQIPGLIDSDCNIANECDIIGSEQLAADVTYFNSTFFSIRNTLTGAISSGELDNNQVAKIRTTLNGFSSWLANLLDGYLRNNIEARRIDNGQPCRYTNLFDQVVFSAVCALPVSESLKTSTSTLSKQAATAASLLDDPTTDSSTPLNPIAVDQVGTEKMLDLMDKLYQAQNNHFYVAIKRSTEASTNTVAILATLKGYEDELSLIIYKCSAAADNSDNIRIELKEARQGIKDLLGLDTEKFYPGSISTIELLTRLNEVHQSENDTLYEIRTRCEEIKDFVAYIRDDTTDLKYYIDQKFAELSNQLANTENNMLNAIANIPNG